MNKIKIYYVLTLITIASIGHLQAQSQTVSIEKDAKISDLLSLKSDLNKDDKSSKKYKIQIYSGTISGAKNKEKIYKSKFSDWSCKLAFETPNYKVWVGNFRTRLEADRALISIKKEFDRAFIFKPKKKK